MPKVSRPSAQDTLPRQWTLFKLLQKAPGMGWSTLTLSKQLHTSKTNVERDVLTLKGAGFPVESTPDPHHHQRLLHKAAPQDVNTAGPEFGPAELLALYAATHMLQFLGNTPMHMDLHHVLSKVRAGMAEHKSKTVPAMASVFTTHLRDHVPYDLEDRRAILDDLVDGVARRRACRLEYQSSDAARGRTYTLFPLRLFAHHNALYLLAQVKHKMSVQTFSVHRILELEVTAETFEPPKLDLDALAAQAFGVFIEPPQDVEVLFEKEVARYVLERIFHPAEHKETLADGRVKYCVRAGGQNEVVAWVLGFGGAASLQKPTAWRAVVEARARRLLSAHPALGEAP